MRRCPFPIVLLSLALVSCQSAAVPQSVHLNGKEGASRPLNRAKQNASEPLGQPPSAPPNAAETSLSDETRNAQWREALGARSALVAPVLSNQGGRLRGSVLLPTRLLGNHAGGLLSEQGGSLISDRGGNLLGNNAGSVIGKTKFFAIRQEDVNQAVEGARVVIVDAAGQWVADDKGEPYVAATDGKGNFQFERTPGGANLLLRVVGFASSLGDPLAFLPANAGGSTTPRQVDVNLYSTLTIGYIREKFVQGRQDILDKLPGDVEAETREKLAVALPNDVDLPSLRPEVVLAQVDAARTKDQAFDAQVRYVESLLVAGLSNMGEGLSALQVALAAPHRLHVMPDGSLYFSETWSGRIRRIAPDGTLRTYAGNGSLRANPEGENVFLGDDGPALQAAFHTPTSLTADAQGNLYLCDLKNHRIRRIDAQSGVVKTVAGNRQVAANTLFAPPVQKGPALTAGTRAQDALITSPHAIASDNQGRCIFACGEGTYRTEADGTLTPLLHAGAVRTPAKLASTPEGQIFAFYGSDFGRLVGDEFQPANDIPSRNFTGNYHMAAAAGNVLYLHGDGALHRFKDGEWQRLLELTALKAPTGLTANQDAVWISSDTAGQIWRYTLATGAFERVAGIQLEPGQGLRGDQLNLNRPAALAYDAQGQMLIADGLNGIIWRRGTDGLYRRVAGNGAPPDQGVTPAQDVPALDAAIDLSTALVPTADGGVLFTSGDQNRYRLNEVNAEGLLRAVPLPTELKPLQVARDAQGALILSDATLVPLPTGRIVRVVDGAVTELVPRKALGAYYGLLPRADGSLYYSDVLDGVIYRRAADGTVAAVAGSPGQGGAFAGDGGPATAARLNFPLSVALDEAGNLYIADTYNHRVRRVDATSGIITTLAGQGGRFFNGEGPDASLRDPQALIFDAAGNLHIADAGHNQVKQIPRAQLNP